MSRERLYLYDTTLRDGAQTTGVDFSLDDKRRIAALLDALGVDYIEGGYPGANPTRYGIFRQEAEVRTRAILRLRHDPRAAAARPPTIPASPLCSMPRPTRSASSRSPGTIMSASRSARRSRRISPASRNRSKRRQARAARPCSIASISSTATRPIRPMRSTCAKAAYEAGARWIVLCDTNGGTLPHEVERIVGEVVKHIPGDHARHPRP